jgi:maltooligosyltrehalose trehalohydrolase
VTLGAAVDDEGGTRFRVWAPYHERVAVRLFPGAGDERDVAMRREARGHHAVTVPDAGPGTRYSFVLGDGRVRADPASRSQPDGPEGASEVVDHRWPWRDEAFHPPAMADLVLYELHVGTFTPEGTFDAVVPALRDLQALGVTAIELMPVAEFPGSRNWGYDGVAPFAAQSSYGGPDGLRRLVDEAHRVGLAVVLDVVHNHLGPEGNHLADFGPYFTDRYRTPWGDAPNFDGAGSDEVREFFVESARWWTSGCHVDGLRLDAVHAIVDAGATPFVGQLTDAVHADGARERRPRVVIAESAANDARLVRDRAAGGLGLDGVWSDDFHHALHAALTGERGGYYADYASLDELATASTRGWAYADRYSAFRGHRFGSDPAGLPADRFVVCAQNHDQIGNRARGERLEAITGPGGPEVAAAAVLLAPFVPLLFMGEEYGDPAPFPYFVSHTDPELVAAVRQGRAEEFADLVGIDAPDPQDPATFASAVLDRASAARGAHRRRLDWYRALLALRTAHPALRGRDLAATTACVQGDALVLGRAHDGASLVTVLHFGEGPATVALPAADLTVLLDSGTDDHADTGPAGFAGDTLTVTGRHAVVLGSPAGPVA